MNIRFANTTVVASNRVTKFKDEMQINSGIRWAVESRL